MNNIKQDKGLDQLLDAAFTSYPDVNISEGFTDRLIRRVERKIFWQTVLAEFGMKVGIIAGTLSVLIGAFIFVFRSEKPAMYHSLLNNWQYIAALALFVFFTFLFDQVLLKYLLSRNK
jgi:hypothetical protein